MPRIDFTAPLIVTDAQGRRVADWSTLSQFVGRSFENTNILGYFGQSIDEFPVAVLLDGQATSKSPPTDEKMAYSRSHRFAHPNVICR